ncbi:DUF6055 domain-containing protein [Bacteroides xylanisolvens]|uniref:DUF6055 domain-containing protein n=1 Tax=Bacteroides xylanisolvens TaxID=371601 RepID=A0AAW4T6Q6_9BACE|nr:DUF6055 domain-containing protein [Bacteroides xylanisolvens]MCA4533571.1 DUF6055 domain-containing protein [Bacteroides xylanisolvens]MCA4551565.1 DUF6055 domain-containing protein [Bacteroides xylanisolvens]MCA4565115.1 DUF6055 domain-containing protein [Bacteroides xylanisolvens]MCA4570134.1 DUF6055 domain-containing protein [Bacteroides xylanisolvens]MCA4600789.1 DUF6055 domain-containing protein [Bacteroides xylanisolvens]
MCDKKRHLYLLLGAIIMALNLQILQAKSGNKIIYIPENDLQKHGINIPDGKFGYDCMAESENLAIFWERSFGKDPTINSDMEKRFYPKEILSEGERYFTYFVDKMKFVQKGKSYADKYKMIIWMYNDDERTVYGGANDNVGMCWFRPCRINSYPYCTLVHELGHAFQYIVTSDSGRGFPGTTLYEYTSQWMLWQVYPDWVTIENYHLNNYMKQTHYTLFHKANHYCAPQFLEYWSYKHGLPIIGRLWREALKDEDAVSTYMRITKTSQEQFNGEIYDAATRFVTWDLPRIESVCRSYANQHQCKLAKADDGWYQIAKEKCPQSYGYNAIRLKVPQGGTEVRLTFEGIAGGKDFYTEAKENAGWRYGFVAVKQDGKRVYGKMNKAVNGVNQSVKFVVPDNTQFLWLVVTGAPDKHMAYHKKMEKVAEWPYKIKLEGSSLHAVAI